MLAAPRVLETTEVAPNYHYANRLYTLSRVPRALKVTATQRRDRITFWLVANKSLRLLVLAQLSLFQSQQSSTKIQTPNRFNKTEGTRLTPSCRWLLPPSTLRRRRKNHHLCSMSTRAIKVNSQASREVTILSGVLVKPSPVSNSLNTTVIRVKWRALI